MSLYQSEADPVSTIGSKMFISRCFRLVPAEDSDAMMADAELLGPGPVQGQIRPRICKLMVDGEL